MGKFRDWFCRQSPFDYITIVVPTQLSTIIIMLIFVVFDGIEI